MKASALVKLFELGKVSSGTAAKVLGLTRLDFLELLAKYKVSPFGQYDTDDLRDDIYQISNASSLKTVFSSPYIL